MKDAPQLDAIFICVLIIMFCVILCTGKFLSL